MFSIVLFEPEIPANTGSIGRTCVATHTPLHLVGRLGFSLEDKYLKRAGLDYWKDVQLTCHKNWNDFVIFCKQKHSNPRFVFFSKKATRAYTDFKYQPHDYLVFGPETRGLSKEFLESPYPCLKIPTPGPVRSLNLSVATGIALFEALRQNGIQKTLESPLKALGAMGSESCK